MRKNDIKDYTLAELKTALLQMGQPPYRATQIFFWLYQKASRSFDDMDNIPKGLREQLAQSYYIGGLELRERLKSKDRSEKFLFKLKDGNFIESVLIYTQSRKTICLSTQVGCKFACPFCASGQRGFARNLSPSEITGQIMFLQHRLKQRINNYVFMGMGEPLDNFKNVSKAIIIMNTSSGMGIGARRITVSTCGIVPGIEKLKQLKLQVNLSISLHAGNDELRNELVPVNRRYCLDKLIKAGRDFINETGRMITLEYILIKDKNDSQQNADELAQVAKKLKAKVNLILYSAIPSLNWQVPGGRIVKIFMKRLRQRKVNATLRQSKGEDIQAACGQLAGR